MAERTALITGGAKGIGKAIGLKLAAEGWNVAFCYRNSAEAASATEAELVALGARALGLRSDVSDPAACAELVERTRNELGPICALINCAGPYHRVAFMKESAEGWREMFDNNLHPVFYLSQLVAPDMQSAGWGRILTFSMANADRMVAQPFVTAHYIAKSGLLILTRTLAKVLGPHGVTVNAISPGFIDSGSAPAEELAGMVKNIPAGYIGELDDALSCAMFLLSEDARYVNGSNLHLSGGWGI